MGVEVFDSSVDPDVSDDLYDNDEPLTSVRTGVDARRKLEDKLEEMRLERELRDFDFDF